MPCVLFIFGRHFAFIALRNIKSTWECLRCAECKRTFHVATDYIFMNTHHRLVRQNIDENHNITQAYTEAAYIRGWHTIKHYDALNESAWWQFSCHAKHRRLENVVCVFFFFASSSFFCDANNRPDLTEMNVNQRKMMKTTSSTTMAERSVSRTTFGNIWCVRVVCSVLKFIMRIVGWCLLSWF